MIKRDQSEESNGKLPHLFIPSKTATLVSEFAVEDLPLGRTPAVVPKFAVKDLPLGRTAAYIYIASMEQSRNTYRVLVGKPRRKSPLGRPRRIWEENIKIDLREVGCNPCDCIDLSEERDQWQAYVREVMNLRVL